MEAAIVAASHGHRVTLFEREEKLGGNVNWIIACPNRLEFGDLIRNKTGELARSGAELRLECEVTPEVLLAERPDVVILATGQEETRPGHIPGMDGGRVRTPLEILRGPRPAARHALIIDEIGGHHATSLAEVLAEGGCRVTMVTSAFSIGQELGVTLDLELWHQRMGSKILDIYAGHIVTSVEGAPALLDIYSGAERSIDGVDLIVPVNHGRPRDALYHALWGQVPVLLRVGDAMAAKDVGEAILDGHRAARQISGFALGWQ